MERERALTAFFFLFQRWNCWIVTRSIELRIEVFRQIFRIFLYFRNFLTEEYSNRN